jgi:hypothetical protein
MFCHHQPHEGDATKLFPLCNSHEILTVGVASVVNVTCDQP